MLCWKRAKEGCGGAGQHVAAAILVDWYLAVTKCKMLEANVCCSMTQNPFTCFSDFRLESRKLGPRGKTLY